MYLRFRERNQGIESLDQLRRQFRARGLDIPHPAHRQFHNVSFVFRPARYQLQPHHAQQRQEAVVAAEKMRAGNETISGQPAFRNQFKPQLGRLVLELVPATFPFLDELEIRSREATLFDVGLPFQIFLLLGDPFEHRLED